MLPSGLHKHCETPLVEHQRKDAGGLVVSYWTCSVRGCSPGRWGPMCGYLDHQRSLMACCTKPVDGLEGYTVWACSFCHRQHGSPHYWPMFEKLVGLRHMTHVDNVPGVMRDGLRCRDDLAADAFTDVSDGEVQDRRRLDPIHSRRLKSYVPLYFSPLNAMYYRVVKTHGADRLCIVEVSPEVIDRPGVLVTDRNAAAGGVRFGKGRAGLRAVDAAATFSREYLGENHERDQRRQAEVLVPDRVGPHHVRALHVVSQQAASSIRERLDDETCPIHVSPNWFFLS